MSQDIPHRNLPQLLLRAREEMLQHFRPIITHFGMTEPQWRIIRAVNEHQKLEPREICVICQILSSSLPGVLVRMEELGLIFRNRMPKDHRRIIVRLTPKSEKIVAGIAPLIERQYALLEQRYGVERISRLYAMVDDILSIEICPVDRVELPVLDF